MNAYLIILSCLYLLEECDTVIIPRFFHKLYFKSLDKEVIDVSLRFTEIVESIVSEIPSEAFSPPSLMNQDNKRNISPSKYGRLNDYCVLLVPGLFCSYVPFYFSEVMHRLNNDLKLDCRYVSVHPYSSVSTNANLLLDVILRVHNETGKRVILVGHSKGGVDASAVIALYPELTLPLVRGLITIQTPYLGSSLIPNITSITRISKVLSENSKLNILERTPISGLQDLTQFSRNKFSLTHPLPVDQLPTLCFSSATSLSLFQGYENDGLVSRSETEIPGSRVVRWETEQNHFFLAQPPRLLHVYRKLRMWLGLSNKSSLSLLKTKSPRFVTSGDIIEALLQLLMEV